MTDKLKFELLSPISGQKIVDMDTVNVAALQRKALGHVCAKMVPFPSDGPVRKLVGNEYALVFPPNSDSYSL